MVRLRALVAGGAARGGAPTQATPTRLALGVERPRVNLLLAVLEKAGLGLGDRDVYVNAAGGVRLHEPAADLGIAAAITSSAIDEPVPADLAFFGEVGLAGEVRSVGYPGLRFAEARRHGFRRVVAPRAAAGEAPAGLEVLPVRRVGQVLDLVRGG